MSEAAAVEVTPRRGPGMMLVVVAAVVAAAAAGIGVYFMTGSKEAAPATEAQTEEEAKAGTPKLPALYVKLDPPFVANFEAKGVMRFLQVSVEVMTRDPAMTDVLRNHEPMIRNDLLMLFGNQSHDTISTHEGKDRLRGEALGVVRKIVTGEGGDGKKIEQVYFTSFVMQ